MRGRKLARLALGATLASAIAAAGARGPETSARALGLAGATTASAQGASAIQQNAANLAFEDGLSAELTGILRWTQLELEGRRSDASPAFHPAAFVAAPWAEDLFIGVGAFPWLQLGAHWPEGLPATAPSSGTTLSGFAIAAAAGYRLSDHLALGLGLDAIRAGLEVQPTASTDRLNASGWTAGAHLGLGGRWLNDSLQVGLTLSGALPARVRGDGLSARLTLPPQAALGASYRAGPRVHLEASLEYRAWSALAPLRVEGLPDALGSGLRDAVGVRAGVELELSRTIALRGGGGYESSSATDERGAPWLATGARALAALGLSYRAGSFGLDAGYQLSLLPTHPSEVGSYLGRTHEIAATLWFRQ